MIGAGGKWRLQLTPNTLITKNLIFVQSPASKVLGNQAREEMFIGLAPLVCWAVENNGRKK